jgi:hypothetical protein
MNAQNNLHFGRLQKSLQAISQFREKGVTAHDPEFTVWKQSTAQSLSELFDKDHDYTRRFSHLIFLDPSVRFTASFSRSPRSSPEWSHQDQHAFENDLIRADAILKDALEEYAVRATQATPIIDKTPSMRRPQFVVNVTNVLSQSTHIELSQILSNLDSLGLSPDQISQAKAHAQELEKEVRGEQRWPILAKSLEALKSMGKTVYENVALPLLLEMLKKQMGQ